MEPDLRDFFFPHAQFHFQPSTHCATETRFISQPQTHRIRALKIPHSDNNRKMAVLLNLNERHCSKMEAIAGAALSTPRRILMATLKKSRFAIRLQEKVERRIDPTEKVEDRETVPQKVDQLVGPTF